MPTGKMRILIVDDNEDIGSLIADMIDWFEVECDTVSSGEEAMGRLKARDYSLVIADTQMPKVSGFDLLKHIKKNYPETQVAMISARNSDMTQGIVVKSAADFYIPKPIKLADVRKLLEATVR